MGLRLGATIVDEIDGTFVTPLPPNQARENGSFWLLRSSSLIWGEGVGRREGAEDEGSMFHFILSKMVV